MQITRLKISDLCLVQPVRRGDHRGWFMESYNRAAFFEAGLNADFVQDNQSFSAQKGTVRGLHWQNPPFEQVKLVRVLRGSILDIAVDIRRSSPTFGQHVAVRLDAEKGASLYIPSGFAHGFCTLEDNVEVAYKVSQIYAPQAEAGLLWHDPALCMDWPVAVDKAIVSDKDCLLPPLAAIKSGFL
jgi:dTDP-4-dehydrorhamnose 3,5-epimerase